MSNIHNENGEPMITAAELRLEAEIDDLSAWERHYDNDDDYYEEDETMARVMECHLLTASGAAVKVRAWFEDGVTQLHGLAAFGYEPISRDEAVEMFGVDQVQGLIRETEKNGEWVA